ncbi:MAG: L,D-transpeptidase [Verrucomicrobia bacterium]|nr:MAG: L,D-transpeptidase [Verrucomicrobiota bacterium]
MTTSPFPLLDLKSELLSTLQSQFLQTCQRLSLPPSPHHLLVHIPSQELYHFINNTLTKSYSISTSDNPPSCQENSFGTPWGMHKIAEKHGDNAPIGTVFKARISTNQTYLVSPFNSSNDRLVTTRILWLAGLELGLNQGPNIDSFERFIYIHGTNREHLIGTPATLGCITLTNKDIITLFNSTPCDSLVYIQK